MTPIAEHPEVTVVMPAYNAASTIDAALQSAIGQQGVTLEVVVVDDGSSDDTVRRARSYGPQVRVFSQTNAGPQAARNRAIAEARGRYVAFLDSDDLWFPGKLVAQTHVLNLQADVSAVFTAWRVWFPEPNGHYVLPHDLTDSEVGLEVDLRRCGWLYTQLLLDVCMLTTTVMARTDTLRALRGFDSELRVGEDYDLWLRLSREGRIVKLASVGALYRMVPGSASRQASTRNWELEVLQRALETWGPAGPDGVPVDPQALRLRLQHLQLNHAGTHLRQGDARLALRGYARLLQQQPLQTYWWLKVLQSLVKAGQQSLTGTTPRA